MDCVHFKSGVLAAGLALVAGCVQFQARPVSPARLQEAFEARTLERADLGDYLGTNGLAASWPLDHWGLSALTLAAFFYHPDLDVARAQLAVAQGELMGAGERPNPSLNLAPGYNSSGTAGAISYWIADAALSIPIETAGKRGYRIAQARHLSESARLNIAQAAWQVRHGVRAGVLDLYAAQENEALARRQQALQDEAATLLQAQAAAGEVPPTEVAQARVREQACAFAVQAARQKQSAARLRLAAAVGVPGKALENARLTFGEVLRLPDEPLADGMRKTALTGRADLLAALEEYEASQAALRLEIAKQIPDVELGPAYQYDQGEDKWALGINVTLPVFNRNQGGIAAAEARRAEAAAKVKALQARVIGEVEQAEAAYRSAREKVASAQRLAAGLEQKEKTLTALRAAGEMSRLEAVADRIERASLEQACLDARLEALQAWGDVEDALQMPLDLSEWARRVPAANAAEAEEKQHE